MENKQNQHYKEHSKRRDNMECYGKGFEALEGSIIAGKYRVGTFIDKGSYGSIYDVEDTS